MILERFAPEAFFETVEREKITHTILAPALINALASHPAASSHDLSSLRCVYYSGAPIAPTVLRRAIEVFGPVFLQGYGSTEGGAIYNVECGVVKLGGEPAALEYPDPVLAGHGAAEGQRGPADRLGHRQRVVADRPCCRAARSRSALMTPASATAT